MSTGNRARASRPTATVNTDHEFQATVVRAVRRQFGLSVKEFVLAVDAGRLNRFDELVANSLDNLKRAGLRP